MTPHDLALLAIDEALKEARELVHIIEKARAQTRLRDYKKARALISDAVSSASYVDKIYLDRCAAGLEACK